MKNTHKKQEYTRLYYRGLREFNNILTTDFTDYTDFIEAEIADRF